MLNKKFLNTLVLSALAFPGLALAADAPAAPTLSAVLDASGVTVSGAIDVSYSKLSGTGAFTSGTNDRVFDYAHNSFTTHAVDMLIAKTPAEGFGGTLELTMGKDASTIGSTGLSSTTTDITQAFVQDAIGNLTVIGGKFATLAGAEYIKSATDTNFSRSILFGYAIPFTHTGVRATYKVSDAASFMAGLSNGWDTASDSNSQKTLELGTSLNPTKTFALTAALYSGAEQSAITNAIGNRTLLDVVGTFTITDSLNIVLNYDTASQDDAVVVGSKAKWDGLAGYVNYQINDPWRVSLRAESFKDTDGYRTGVAQTWKEVTVTLGYAVSKNTELRGELRKDTSDVASFAFSDGIARKSQDSVGLEAVYKF
jgi:Putative beta-barrel porin-2, OmpL-like. bbp2